MDRRPRRRWSCCTAALAEVVPFGGTFPTLGTTPHSWAFPTVEKIGFPICIELNTGKVKWGGNQRGPGEGSAAVCYADGRLYFRYEDGTMALIEATPKEYRLKGSFKLASVRGASWPHPSIADGKLYLRDQDVLMCYDVHE
jgi:hypothetical protein